MSSARRRRPPKEPAAIEEPWRLDPVLPGCARYRVETGLLSALGILRNGGLNGT